MLRKAGPDPPGQKSGGVVRLPERFVPQLRGAAQFIGIVSTHFTRPDFSLISPVPSQVSSLLG
jgi:hypothetical protein